MSGTVQEDAQEIDGRASEDVKTGHVNGCYDPSIMGDYRVRYNLFMLAVLFTGLIAIIIPFIIR